MAVLIIDGVELKSPSSYSIGFQDLDSNNSFTSESGVLNRDVIDYNYLKINVKWDRLTNDECMNIYNAINGKSGFSLTYFDPRFMVLRTKRCYAGNRDGSGIKVREINGRWSLGFTITSFMGDKEFL